MDQEAGRKFLAPPARKQSKAYARTRSGKAAMNMACKQIICLFKGLVWSQSIRPAGALMSLKPYPCHKASYSGLWTYIGPIVCWKTIFPSFTGCSCCRNQSGGQQIGNYNQPCDVRFVALLVASQLERIRKPTDLPIRDHWPLNHASPFLKQLVDSSRVMGRQFWDLLLLPNLPQITPTKPNRSTLSSDASTKTFKFHKIYKQM